MSWFPVFHNLSLGVGVGVGCSFSNHFKRVWHCSLCFTSLPSVKIWREGTKTYFCTFNTKFLVTTVQTKSDGDFAEGQINSSYHIQISSQVLICYLCGKSDCDFFFFFLKFISFGGGGGGQWGVADGSIQILTGFRGMVQIMVPKGAWMF